MTTTQPNPRRHPLIGVLLLLSFIGNVAALCLPFVMVDAAGSSPVSYGLLGSVQMLIDEHMLILGALVVTFSVLLPFAKLLALAFLWWTGVGTRWRHAWLVFIEKVGKWSFFDVFLVAILVGITDNQLLLSSASLRGLTFFMVALALGMLAGEILSATSPAVVISDKKDRHGPRKTPSLLLLFMLIAIGGLLAATLFLPCIQIDDWRLRDRAFSLYDMIPALGRNGSPFLAIIFGAFLIVAPILGWLTAMVMTIGWWRRSPPYRLVRFQRMIGRWSMLPVFALSLGIFFAEGDRFLGTLPKAGSWMLISGLALVIVGQFIVGRAWRPHSVAVAQDSPIAPLAPFA